MNCPKGNRPVVSVIVPVYNAERYLGKCIDSVRLQTLDSLEIICVDDGSTDSSLALLEKYALEDGRMVILSQANKGSGSARNLALLTARGDYVSFLDADDFYPSADVLEALVNSAESNNTLVSGGGVCLLDGERLVPGKDRGGTWFFQEESVVRYRDFQDDYGYQRFLFSRDLLVGNNVQFPGYRRFQDPPFLVKAMTIAQRFSTVAIDTYGYRVSHKEVEWTDEKVIDLVLGVCDVLELALENDYRHIINRTFHRVNREYKTPICESLKRGNEKLLELMVFLNCRLYEGSSENANGQPPRLIEPLRALVRRRRSFASRVFRSLSRIVKLAK